MNLHGFDPESVIGREVHGFRFDALRGEGPTSYVFTGVQVALQRPVAIRLLHPNLAEREAALNGFLQAGRRSSSLIHPGIVPIFNIVSEGELHCIIEELIQVPPLRRRIESTGALAPDQVVKAGYDAAQALQYAHEVGVIHGNLSPSNLFVAEGGSARLNDFLHASFRDGEGHLHPARLCGVAPEMLGGEVPTAASDVFGLGSLIYFAATGAPPYEATQLRAMAAGQHPNAPRMPEELGTPSLLNLVEAMLQGDPKRRPGAMAEVVHGWREATCGEEATRRRKVLCQVSLEELPPPAKRRYRRLPANLDVVVAAQSASRETAEMLFSKIQNLSENGAYVPARHPLPIGSFVSLEFTLEKNDTRVKATGVVRWVDETEAGRGMGIQFIKVTTHDRRNLRAYVDDHFNQQMVETLTSSPIHRKVLREVLMDQMGSMSIRALMRQTGSGQTILGRVLQDFQHFGLIRVGADKETLELIPPASEEMLGTLHAALFGGGS